MVSPLSKAIQDRYKDDEGQTMAELRKENPELGESVLLIRVRRMIDEGKVIVGQKTIIDRAGRKQKVPVYLFKP